MKATRSEKYYFELLQDGEQFEYAPDYWGNNVMGKEWSHKDVPDLHDYDKILDCASKKVLAGTRIEVSKELYDNSLKDLNPQGSYVFFWGVGENKGHYSGVVKVI
jgi:hypothetical protein